MDELVHFEVSESIATITLNRPKKLNAVTFELFEQLREALRRARTDPDVRCVILTGAGRAFCAGDDIEKAWGNEQTDAVLRELSGVEPRLTPEVTMLLDYPKATIAAVNGPALGVGMDFALMCDIRVASERAQFGQLYVRMGLMPDIPGLWRLPQLVGPAKAAELLLTGELVDAAEAVRIGLVSRVVPHEELMPTARALAARIAANSPLSVRYIKEGLRQGIGRSCNDLVDLGGFVGRGLAALFQSEEHKRAARAFLERAR